jgi:CheY-like chemotaxis protein
MARILVIDDNASICDLMEEILSGFGHQVILATSAVEGIRLAREKNPDLVILDRNMPKIDGIQALGMLRSIPQTQNLKVVMCTSARQTGSVVEAFAAGATDYVFKPISIRPFAEKIAEVLART